ncbi:hypothetical protein D8Y22_02100 [Salinadaptatus halalkaliphilus]|uniref:DNA phosphorothioation-associated protein 4 n=1 Tax=Salinadaptatus halalkaliphilus TaxID=2419781 RepID=A0A4S3TQ48_9EURY|nr:hypothetical protein [Salinadaptatus halalkaliphilus]THE66471.1 hypothetical protein D8Y22_02100 [Salinadaptatus halalkaliphilus]
MSFRLSDDAREYFDDIEDKSSTGRFDSMWDKYYFAAMIGIKARDRVPIDKEPSAEPFVDTVIEDYADQKFELYAALIMAEINRQHIPKEEEDEIRELMLNILDSTDPTRLSDHGKELLNCYAEQGHKILQNSGPTPKEFDEFLRQYHKVLNEI